MRCVAAAACAAALGMTTVTLPSPVRADDGLTKEAPAPAVVTYEVVSDQVGIANIEWQDADGRMSAWDVVLPWRADVAVKSVRGAPPDGSQVRADWRRRAAPSNWVTVRIIHQGKVICQNTLDIGNATCYGITPHIT